jgi:hypothetical protein
MKGSIEIPFAIGSKVWWVGPGYKTEWVTCPECAGTRLITMRLGNGEEFQIACQTCGSGYDVSRGVIEHTIVGYEPVEVTLTKVQFSCDKPYYEGDGAELFLKEGHIFHYHLEADSLFLNREECAIECAKRRIEQQKNDDDNWLGRCKSKRRDMAWSVTYWKRQRADLLRQLEAVEKRLGLCIEREKAKKSGSNTN